MPRPEGLDVFLSAPMSLGVEVPEIRAYAHSTAKWIPQRTIATAANAANIPPATPRPWR